MSDSLIALNQAKGGAGDGGNGGTGSGGGVFNGGSSPFGTPRVSFRRTVVALNRAVGGTTSGGGNVGQGVGGGLYLTSGGVASADFLTLILANDASTSDDDVFGILS